MSERVPSQNHEKEHSAESKLSSAEHREKLQQNIEAGKQAKHEAQDQLEAIRSSIEKEAETSEHSKQEQARMEAKDKGPSQVLIDRNIRKKAYKKELHRVQAHLPKAQRPLSKFIHARPVEVVSEVGGKTVARPSGLLGGGIAAFVGTLALVLLSRHYGFSYNFFVFVLLLIAGFFVGLIIELVVRSIARARS